MGKIGLSKGNLYVRGAARYHDLVYLALKDRKLDRKSVAHTRLVSIDGGEVATVKDLNWAAAGICVVKKPTEKLIAVSEEGAIFTYVGGSATIEEIIPRPFQLRFCGAIAGVAYACGMKRQVYARRDEGRWTPMHAPEGDGKKVAGFEAIAGVDSEDIYAVGWEGEIWQFAKNRWIQRASPANVVLTGACCAPDGNVYVCGQNGILMKGRDDDWDVLEQEEIEDDFWDIRWFNGRLYVASMSALYVLDGGQLMPVDFGEDGPRSFYKLTDADGILWSVGQENLFSYDGRKWTRWD